MGKILRFVEPTHDYNLSNPNSVLIDQVVDTVPDGEYHTSLGDISAADAVILAGLFDIIEFVPDRYDTLSTLYQETIILLNFLSHQIRVENLPSQGPRQFLSSIDIRDREPGAMLWTFGCSHTWGAALDNPTQRYSEIMSQKLGIPVRVVALPGTSIDWSLRHIIHANIRPDDLVIWQLTTAQRFTKLTNYFQGTNEMMLKNANKIDVVFWTDEQLYLKQLSALSTGVAYLRGKDCKFLLTSLHSYSELDYQLLLEYTKYPEYCYLPNYIVDRGCDGLHYGPLTHRNLAMGLLDRLQSIYDKLI